MDANLLFVDDEEEVREVFRLMASKLGYRPHVAASGMEAIEMVQRHNYPVICTDLRMPGLDGFALLECLRGLSPQSVTMVATGAPQAEIPSRNCSDQTLAAILYKPVEMRELQTSLGRAFEMYEERRSQWATPPMRVLLVGVDRQLQGRLEEALPDGSLQWVEGLATALEWLEGLPWSVVVCPRDRSMVERLHWAHPEVALVVVAEDYDEVATNAAIQAGAQEQVILGEADPATLARALRYALGRKDAERRLFAMAHQDLVTGLPNRQLLHDLLVQALGRSRKLQNGLAVIQVNLCRFRAINETLGFEVGDRLLREQAGRLLSCLRDCDAVGRLGGDEFGLIVEGQTPAEVEALAQRLLQALRQPFLAAGEMLAVGACLGLALHPDNGLTAEGLFLAADQAVREARQTRSGYRMARQGRSQVSLERLRFEEEVRQAWLDGQFRLHYQPVVDPRQRKVVCLEALLRWHRCPPAVFLPILTDLGLMGEVGDWVVRQACLQARAWRAHNWRIAVNVAAGQIREGFVDRVAQALEQAGLPPSLLELEFSERVLMAEPEGLHECAQALRKMGVLLALDDFGTGHSSLNQLKELPFHSVKLDPQFLGPSNTPEVIQAVVDLGHALKMVVVGEGVETVEQYTLLGELAADLLQGRFIADAMAGEEVLPWFESALNQPGTT